MNLELIFLQVDFFSHFMGGGAGGFSWAVSTWEPGTFLQMNFNIGLKPSCFWEFISRVFVFFLKLF